MTVDGKQISSGYAVTLKSKQNLAVSVKAKSGYEYSGLKSVDGNGNVKNYTVSTVSFSVDSTTNVIVMTKKKNSTVQPDVYTGSRAVLALSSDGTLYGWGENDLGQLGITAQIIKKPVPIFSGAVKAGSLRTPNSISREHFPATSMVLRTASASSGKASSISCSDFR